MLAGVIIVETVVKKIVVDLDAEDFGWHLERVAELHAKARVWREENPGEQYHGWPEDRPAPPVTDADYESARPVVLDHEAREVAGNWPDFTGVYLIHKHYADVVPLDGSAKCDHCGEPITVGDFVMTPPPEVDEDMFPDAASWSAEHVHEHEEGEH